MTTYYHGAHTRFALHRGLCLTDDPDVAVAYTQGSLTSFVAVLELEPYEAGEVGEVEAYDRETDTAPGDDDDGRGYDVLSYDDEDPRGTAHETIRLMSDRALAAAEVVVVLPTAWFEALDSHGVEPHDMEGVAQSWQDAGADADDYESWGGDLEGYRLCQDEGGDLEDYR